MQQPLCQNCHIPRTFTRKLLTSTVAFGIAALLFGVGCSGDSGSPITPRAGEGIALSICSGDSAFLAAVSPAAQSWATRTGARVELRSAVMTPGDDCDIGILSVPEVGDWANRGELARIPGKLRFADHPFQWTGVLSIYREQLSEWGGQAQAIPLAGDGFVVLYRTDRLADPTFVDAFTKALGRKPVAPATWEDFADLAVHLAAATGQPSLPPMSSAEVADLFFRIAACYDRPAVAGSQTPREGALSLLHDVTTGKPRLDSPGFSAAGELFARLAQGKCFASPVPDGKPSDPVAALADRAALGVLSLAELSKLPRENGIVPARFGIAPLPGTKRYFDRAGFTTSSIPNYIPYHSGGRVGVVRSRCANPDAAFDLLAELGGPARSLEILGTPGLGAGPFRLSHLERERLHIWYGYGLDAARTKLLQQAMQQYVRQEVRAPALGLRGPDQEQLSAAAARELGKIVSGTPPADALKSLTDAWNAIDEKVPLETRLQWRKMAVGAN
jgi:multiple sugar transport system substrate-binding protein